MHVRTTEDLVGTLAANGVFLQTSVCEAPEPVGTIYAEFFCPFLFDGVPRREFAELHYGYKPTPEIYLSTSEFDRFCPPRKYIDYLGIEPPEKLGHFIEALGCYRELNDHEIEDLNSLLTIPLPHRGLWSRPGIVLMCWDRLKAAEENLGASGLLVRVVGFHEHSHAARAAKLLENAQPKIRQAEETVAQWETYMLLGRRTDQSAQSAIFVMKELMKEQPPCYRIPIP